jgi:hypothetical protein
MRVFSLRRVALPAGMLWIPFVKVSRHFSTRVRMVAPALVNVFVTYLLLDSFSCANGICENNCRSTIRQSFRSN